MYVSLVVDLGSDMVVESMRYTAVREVCYEHVSIVWHSICVVFVFDCDSVGDNGKDNVFQQS